MGSPSFLLETYHYFVENIHVTAAPTTFREFIVTTAILSSIVQK